MSEVMMLLCILGLVFAVIGAFAVQVGCRSLEASLKGPAPAPDCWPNNDG